MRLALQSLDIACLSQELDLMPANTPLARSKTAAMTRVVDAAGRGYTLAVSGRCSASKALPLAQKLHTRYGIGCTPSQRITRKAKGMANAILVMYLPEGAEELEWLMLFTPGQLEGEKPTPIDSKPRLQWLGYELIRHNARGKISWTWRRPKPAMAEAFATIKEYGQRRNMRALGEYLATIARQPGFHGVREQSKTLFAEARRRGYSEELPRLFYVQKLSHGERLNLQ